MQETNNSLAEKAVDIKGKKYVLVSDRVLAFNELYPKGSIFTELVSDPDSQRVIVKATVQPNDQVEPNHFLRSFTGYASETIGKGFINQSSALENAETSAVGRALAMMGIGVLDSIASADEVNKAINTHSESNNASTGQNRASGTIRALAGLPQGSQDEPPFDENTPPRKEWKEKKVGEPCEDCGAPNIIYKKSGKIGCSKYCWRKE